MTRYRCTLQATVHCVNSRGDGQPTRKACKYCGASFLIERGQYGAFEWADGHYPLADAERTFTSEKAADRWAAARNLVVRWIPA